MSEPHEDLQLVRDALAGSEPARDELAKRLRCIPRILYLRGRELGVHRPPDELDELSQDVMARVLPRLSSFEGRGSFEAWIYRFCVFAELDAYRKRRRRMASLDDQPDFDIATAEDDSEHFETVELLQDALQRLSQGEREVIELHHYQHLTFEEVGAKLDQPVSSTKTKYYRGLSKLRRWLPGHLDEREAER